MTRRIEVELTSERDDGTWTWRAAGAREPKGSLDGSLLPADSKLGDVLRADADFDVEGIVVVQVLAPKPERQVTFETLELMSSGRDEPLVTSTLTSKGRGSGSRDRNRDGDRRPRQGRGKKSDAKRRDSRGGDRRDRPPDQDARPRRKRLKAGRVHRRQAVEALPEVQHPLAEFVLRGGVPEVRQTVERQHREAQDQGLPLIDPAPLVALAERLLPRLRAAEWRDRAEAALADIDEVDLRDLRSVVTAAETTARDDTARELAESLRVGLMARVEKEHGEWLTELADLLRDGRIVRALRLSSRPPKAGSPLPAEIADKLAELATAGLTADITQDRFATLLEAVSYSPVHARVAATSIPKSPGDELRKLLGRIGSRVPGVAAQFSASA